MTRLALFLLWSYGQMFDTEDLDIRSKLGPAFSARPCQSVVYVFVNLPLLSNLSILRHVLPQDCLSIHLHGYADAPLAGFGCAVYISELCRKMENILHYY